VGCEAEYEVMVVEVNWDMVRWLEDAGGRKSDFSAHRRLMVKKARPV